MMGVGVHHHDAVGHDPDVAFPEHEIAALKTIEMLGRANQMTELGELHIAIARRRLASGMQRHLNNPRAVNADTGAPAPQIGRADKAFGDLDEIACRTVNR